MQPNKKFITIKNNLNKIKKLLDELVLQPRINAIKWSSITKQTPNIKIGYPGQHLASLITGMEGERTGARGNDLVDGSEVKSCSRIDQLDICQNCKRPVARLEQKCNACGSSDILRKNDSKWLFAIRNEDELNFLLHGVKRILLVIADYPNFDKGDFENLRFQSFEIWPEHPRNAKFSEIISNYYYKIYQAHKKINPNKNPAPKNFWPYQYQFYICNPVLTFSCIVHNANSSPKIEIKHYLDPASDRSEATSVLMPPNLLTENEIDLIIERASRKELKKVIRPRFMKKLSKIKSLSFKEKQGLFIGIDEPIRRYLLIRDTDRIATAKTKYERRNYSE